MGDDSRENSEIDVGMTEVEQGEEQQGLVEELERSGTEIGFGEEIGKEHDGGSSIEAKGRKLVGETRKSWEIETVG